MKLSREKTFTNFEVLGLSAKVFSMKIDGCTHTLLVAPNNPRKFSPRISYIHQFTKVFSLESFLLYGSLLQVCIGSNILLETECRNLYLNSYSTHPHTLLSSTHKPKHRYNNRTYRIDEIDWDKNPQSTFLNHQGEPVSFTDYYKLAKCLKPFNWPHRKKRGPMRRSWISLSL